MTGRPDKLTARQRRFVAEYLVDLNATQAAIRAGYATKTANQAGPRLLVNVGISAAIAAAMRERAERVELKQDEVLRVLLDLLRSDVRDFSVDDDGRLSLCPGAPDRAWKAVQSVKHRTTTRRTADNGIETEREIELRLWSKPDALRLAAQHLGMLIQRHEVSGANSGPIQHAMTLTADERAARLAALLDRVKARREGTADDIRLQPGRGPSTNGRTHA